MVTLTIVKDNGYTIASDHALIIELEKRLGSLLKITIQHIETLDRSKGNKLKTVVSFIDENIKKNFLQGTNSICKIITLRRINCKWKMYKP